MIINPQLLSFRTKHDNKTSFMTFKRACLNYSFLFISGILLFSCSSSYKIKITNPPTLVIQGEVNKVGVFNRSLPHESGTTNTKIDELLSLEGLKLDEIGSNACVNRLSTLLSQKSRYKSSQVIDHIEDTTVYVFTAKPEPIPWNKVNAICEKNGLDALFVLEAYDTESSFTQRSAPVTRNVPVVGDVTTLQFYVTVTTQIKAYWRIYNYKDQETEYKISYDEKVVTRADGISLLAAYNAAKGREQNVINKSHQISQDISNDLEPYTYWASRDYYSGGSENLKAGKKRVETSSWDAAKDLWEKDKSNPKDKIKGRAYYNLAHWAEIKGDLDKAIAYATEAYHISGNSRALEYIKVLKNLQNRE